MVCLGRAAHVSTLSSRSPRCTGSICRILLSYVGSRIANATSEGFNRVIEAFTGRGYPDMELPERSGAKTAASMEPVGSISQALGQAFYVPSSTTMLRSFQIP